MVAPAPQQLSVARASADFPLAARLPVSGSVLEAGADAAGLRLDELFTRLDARRKREAEGQLGLDLGGKGKGQPCGNSWIAPDDTCHKGQGPAPVDPPKDTRRRRPVEPIGFDPPLKGPSGAELVAYEWQWMMDSFQDSHGEEQLRRVSNWEASEQNAETGRRVVHQFKVRKPDGSTSLVSSETAVRLLGYASAEQKAGFKRVRSVAHRIASLEMEKAQLQQDRERVGRAFDEVEKLAPPEPQLRRHEWGLYWEMSNSRAGAPAHVEPRRVGAQPRRASTPEEAFLMPHERSRLVSEWQAERVGELIGKRYMQPRGGYEATMDAKVAELDKKIKGARKRLEEVVAAEAKPQAPVRADVADTLTSQLDALDKRLDALRRKCTTGYGCGATCISVQKECRNTPRASTSKERLQRLHQLARGEIKPRGIGVLKPEQARAKAAALAKEAADLRQSSRSAKASKPAGKPSVEVKLRRAKPGGEYGPDGHWYPGGAWMSEGSFVGIKSTPSGTGQKPAAGSNGSEGGDQQPRVVRPKEKPRRVQPTEPKGEGLPRPTGLKKTAQKNDEEFFNDRGYISERLPYGDQRIGTPAFMAAVAQRMSTEELNWATDQIARTARLNKGQLAEDLQLDARVYGSEKAALDYHRSFARNQLTGVDDDRLKAAMMFMEASRSLGTTSPAQQRLRERQNNYETQANAPQRKPRAQVEGSRDPGYGDWVWALNNVFRAVRIRRGSSNG